MKHQVDRRAERRSEDFLTALSDEFRNSLGSLRNAVQVLQRVGSPDTRIVSVQAVLDRQVSQLSGLLDDLLDLWRLSRRGFDQHHEAIALSEVARRAAALAQPRLDARGLVLHLHASSEVAWLSAEAARLAQVLANLIEESAKRAPPRASIRFRSQLDRGAALFTITAPALREAEGTAASDRAGSLRLQLARRMVEMHQGQFESLSRSDKGEIEFRVRLPARRQPALPPAVRPAAQVPAPADGRPRRVLVIDDNIDAAESLALILSLEGYAVRVAHEGGEGVELARGDMPDVVFIDIGLPGIDGFEVARQLRRLPGMQRALLVAVTGFDRDDFPARSRAAGIDRHLIKPVDPALLEQILARPAAH